MRQEATVRLHNTQILTANQRLHWRKEAEMKAVLVAYGQLKLGRGLKPMTGKVQVTAEFTFPIKRRRDRANLHPTVKSLVDGVVKARTALIDDSDKHIAGPDIVITDGKSDPGWVDVTLILEDVSSVRRARLVEAERQIMQDREEARRVKAAYDRDRKR